MRSPRIQVLLDDAELTPEVHVALQRIEAHTDFLPLTAFSTAPNSEPALARVVLTRDARSLTNGKLGAFLAGFDRAPCATLILSLAPLDAEHPPEQRTPDRPIRFAFDLTTEQVVERLNAMLAFSATYEKLRRELEDLKRRDEVLIESLRRFESDLRLAGLIQRDLFRSNPPRVSGATIHTLSRPVEAVSGDILHVARIDEDHVAIAVADATGHGIAGGMLSVFVQRALHGLSAAEAFSPEGVLTRLNREILATQLGECHFVTAVYAVYNERTRQIRWARAGAPYPILVRAAGRPRPVVSEGPLLGVSPNAVFQAVTTQLGRDDALLFHSDGLEGPTSSGVDAELPSWLVKLESDSFEGFFCDLDRRLTTQHDIFVPSDDTSVIAIQCRGGDAQVSEAAGGSISGSRSTPRPSATRLM